MATEELNDLFGLDLRGKTQNMRSHIGHCGVFGREFSMQTGQLGGRKSQQIAAADRLQLPNFTPTTLPARRRQGSTLGK